MKATVGRGKASHGHRCESQRTGEGYPTLRTTLSVLSLAWKGQAPLPVADGLNIDPDEMGNRPEDPSLITAPAGIGPGDDGIDPRIGQVPVCVVGFFVPNASLQVKNLLPHGRY